MRKVLMMKTLSTAHFGALIAKRPYDLPDGVAHELVSKSAAAFLDKGPLTGADKYIRLTSTTESTYTSLLDATEGTKKAKPKLLSILILTLPTRQEKLDRLLAIIKPQIDKDIEVWINYDERVKSIGQKRNELLDLAKGQYVAFIDDDDTIADNYTSILRPHLESGVDVIGISCKRDTEGEIREYAMSLDGEERNKQRRKDNTPVCHGVTHLCPVKLQHAQAIRFPHISFGEDTIYAKRLKEYLITNEHTNSPTLSQTLYYYHFVGHKNY